MDDQHVLPAFVQGIVVRNSRGGKPPASRFPDGRYEIEEVLVAGSHGISRCRFVGTHTGEFQGRAPTGKKVSVAVIHIDRFQGDMVVAHRGQIDMHGLLAQLDDD